MNEALNNYLWDYYTHKAAIPYIEKMLSLTAGDSSKLITTLHDAPYDGYYVYMLDSLPMPGNSAGRYDFMIEFGMNHPSIGIYYGVRSVAEWDSDPMKAIQLADSHWEQIRSEVTEVLNATFPDLDFSQKFKSTDNADNLTYWPFWLSLESGEDIRAVAVRALLLIRDTYSRHFNIPTTRFPEILKQHYEENTRTRFTTLAYKNLQQQLTHRLKAERKSVTALLDKFLEKSLEKGWLERDIRMEYAFRFKQCCGLQQTSGCAIMLMALIQTLNQLLNSIPTHKLGVPWEAFSSVLLNSNGYPMTPEALKTKITKRYNRDLASPDTEIDQIKAAMIHMFT